jgi:phage shock protein C
MYCTKCGIQMNEGAKFCADCGAPTANNAYSMRPYPKLSRPREDRKVAGVCAGFARYLGVDVTLVRLVWLVLAIFPLGLGFLAYLVGWIVMPNDPFFLSAPQTSNAEPAGGHA